VATTTDQDNHEQYLRTSALQPQEYQKRPVKVRAIQFVPLSGTAGAFAQNWKLMVEFTNHLVRYDTEDVIDEVVRSAYVYDRLHDTWVKFDRGDYLIRGVQGEFYPCKEDVFRETYVRVGIR
jgi:hypothetical protein